jgi:protein-disulfide isomerase
MFRSILFRSVAARVLACLTFALLISVSAIAQQSESLAVVNGDVLTSADLQQQEGNRLLQARYQYYQAQAKALEDLIDQRLLEQEAHRQGVTVDQLRKKEIDAQVKEPAEDQLEIYYEGMDSKEPFDKVKSKIRDHIIELRTAKLSSAYIESLRLKANIMVQLAPPMASVEVANAAAVEGPANAPAQLIEFADFQCPYCQKVNPEINKLLQEFNGKLSFVYKDFPLPMHANAEKAAEAARCAGEQGKFWDYHNLLFTDKKLQPDDLKLEAGVLKLDTVKFDDCLDSGKEAASVNQDRTEGLNLGLSGTPSFFLNGHFFSGAVDYKQLHQMVEQQLNTLLSSENKVSPPGSTQR